MVRLVRLFDWFRFLNTLHKDLGGNKKPDSSVIHRAFQGDVQVKIDKPKHSRKAATATDDKKGSDADSSSSSSSSSAPSGTTTIIDGEEYISSVETKPFLYLSLALPSAPLFKETADRSLIPQVCCRPSITPFCLH
jgi:U4/U6.U5 tri-snRNP-associated protein 2